MVGTDVLIYINGKVALKKVWFLTVSRKNCEPTLFGGSFNDKPIVSVAAMQLVEEESTSESFNNFVPAFGKLVFSGGTSEKPKPQL